jgi:hypothetical protein
MRLALRATVIVALVGCVGTRNGTESCVFGHRITTVVEVLLAMAGSVRRSKAHAGIGAPVRLTANTIWSINGLNTSAEFLVLFL